MSCKEFLPAFFLLIFYHPPLGSPGLPSNTSLTAELTFRLSSHHARDTFAMNLLNEYRVPIHVLSKLLGHASVVTTERHYAHLLYSSVDDYL